MSSLIPCRRSARSIRSGRCCARRDASARGADAGLRFWYAAAVRQVFLALPPFQKFLEELLLSLVIGPLWCARLFRSGRRNRSVGRIRRLCRLRRVYRRDFGRWGGFGLRASNLRGRFVSLNGLQVRCLAA